MVVSIFLEPLINFSKGFEFESIVMSQIKK